MKKIYIVRLNDAERETCLTIIKKLKGSSEKSVARTSFSKPMPMDLTGKIKTSPMPFSAQGKVSKTFANDL